MALSTARGSRVSRGFLIPALAGMAIFIVIPALAGRVLSFTDWKGFGDLSWIGFDNYVKFFSSAQSIQSLVNTAVLAAVIVVGQNLLGLALALINERRRPGSDVLQGLFLMPVIISPVIISYLWQYIYAPTGALNSVLGAVGLSGLERSWLGDPQTALGAIAVTIIWQQTGTSMVIYLAGLRGIPAELTEAAQIDGARWWTRLSRVKIPLIAPAITINLVLTLIAGLRVFDQIIAMTGGGPGYATDTLSTVIYKKGFGANQLSYGLTMAIILSIAIAVVAVVQTVLLRRREEAMR